MTLNDLARCLRKDQTDAERKMWTLLRCRRLCGFKFRRQQPLGPYIVDFLCKDRGLVVELDGGQHLNDVKNDVERTGFLKSHGLHVIRFWNQEVLKNPRVILDSLWKELQSRPPHPDPLPRGEGKPLAGQRSVTAQPSSGPSGPRGLSSRRYRLPQAGTTLPLRGEGNHGFPSPLGRGQGEGSELLQRNL